MPAPSDPTETKVRAAGMLLVSLHPHVQFLLLRHPNRWDLPKGHCDGDETFLEAALRETEEETGIAARDIEVDGRFVFEVVYPVTYRRTGDRVFLKTVRYFLGYLQSIPELRLTEHDDSRWFPWNPPHQIQAQTIDPLLAAVEAHWQAHPLSS